MRKILVSLMICVLCLMLPVMALALTQTEWNQQCRMKTSATVTLYSTDRSDSTSGSLATGTDIDMWESGSLPAGTYIKVYSYDEQLDMRQIGYYNNGKEGTAFVRSNALVPAVAYVEFDDGTTIDVPEALLKDQKALFAYLAKEIPGYTFSAIAGSSVIHKEKGTSSDGTGSGDGLSDWERLQQAAERAALALNVDENGLPRALVYAPRTGKASLWNKPSGKRNVIEKLKDGTIVSIVEEGSKYTQVLYDGKAGYILNSALETLDPEQLPMGEGVLSYNGKTSGGTGINVRSDASSKARKIDVWPRGTKVIIWSVSEDGGWYEIQHDDMRLYVQAKYLTITQLYEYDEEEEAEPEEAETEEAVEETDAEESDGEQLNG